MIVEEDTNVLTLGIHKLVVLVLSMGISMPKIVIIAPSEQIVRKRDRHRKENAQLDLNVLIQQIQKNV